MTLTAKTALLLATSVLPSCMRVAFYRVLGFHIGKGAKLSIFSVVSAPHVSIGTHTKIWPFAVLISSSALRIGSYCQVTSFAFAYGDRELILEDGSYVGPRAIINTTEPVKIGPNSGVGPSSMLYTHGVFLPYSRGYPRRLGPITLEENVWLMLGVSVLPGVTIGANSIIAGGLVISKSIPRDSYVQGQISRLRIAKIDLLKHDRTQRPNEFTRELLAGLAHADTRFHHKKTGELAYELSLGSDTASLCVVDAAGNEDVPPPARTQDTILFLFNAGGAAAPPPECSTCFDIDRLTVTATPSRISRFMRVQLNRYFGMNFRYAGRHEPRGGSVPRPAPEQNPAA